jgi:hypothetical protein
MIFRIRVKITRRKNKAFVSEENKSKIKDILRWLLTASKSDALFSLMLCSIIRDSETYITQCASVFNFRLECEQ